ncbi:MAG: nitrous oxide reductase family maturation protein NosD [Bacteroidetes bacterium]|nr:nitrous oxide reductase family maturation protein NosD [Bacteroidota bacterium]
MIRILIWFSLLLHGSCLFASDLEVGRGKGFSTLQSAVDKAKPGDRILVYPGTYEAINLKIEKPLTIEGKDWPVLDAKGKDDGIAILCSDVTVKGLVIKNTNRGSLKDYAGIRVFKASNIVISGNQLINAFFGIYLSDARNVHVTNNKLKGEAPDQSSSGNGIHLWQCANSVITGNHITGHRDGIYFEFARHGFIEKNVSEKNHRYGLHFMFSDSNIFHNNQFVKNGTGVAVMYSTQIQMLHNDFAENWGGSAYGILLKDIKDSHIRGNRFEKNTTAMYVEGSSRVKVDSNRFVSNGWAVKLLASCQQDTFTCNNFIANTFDISTNGTLYMNYFQQNYWEKYDGYDLNRDRNGDVPHRPVSLYSLMVEKMPFMIFLLRSFIIDLLDTSERNVPSLIPENIVDVTPRMKELELND